MAVLFLSLYGGQSYNPKGNSRRLLSGAKLSAACGRRSEVKHGQNKEKSTQCVIFDYVLPRLDFDTFMSVLKQ